MSEVFPLKDFIKQTLVDICEAVEEARATHDYIAPQFSESPNDGKSTLINFDVAITATGSSSKSTKVGAGVEAGVSVNVLVMKADIGSKVEGDELGTNAQSHSQVSRIQFGVPVHFRLNKKLQEERQATIEKSERFFRSNGRLEI